MQTVKYKGLEVTVRGATVEDDLHAQTMSQKLLKSAAEGSMGYWALFADLLSSTVSAAGLPFDPLTLLTADKPALDAAYEQFLKLPKRFKDKWRDAYNRENSDTDPVTGPTPLPEGADPNS